MNEKDVERAAKNLPGAEITVHGGTKRLKYQDQILAYPSNGREFTEAFARGVARWFRRLGIPISILAIIFILIRAF